MGFRTPAPSVRGVSFEDFRRAGGDVWYEAGRTVGDTTTSATASAGRYAYPFLSGQGGVIDRLALDIDGVSAGAQAYFGIYTNTARDVIHPITPLYRSAVIDTSAVGFPGSATVVSIELDARELFWAVIHLKQAQAMRCLSTGGRASIMGQDGTAGAVRTFHGNTPAFAALPDPYPAGEAFSSPGANLPSLLMRWGSYGSD